MKYKKIIPFVLNQGEGGGGERCGDINFSIDYDFTSQTLKLKIIQVGLKAHRFKRVQIQKIAVCTFGFF